MLQDQIFKKDLSLYPFSTCINMDKQGCVAVTDILSDQSHMFSTDTA